MELMASRWTDERMDDLKQQVDDLGRQMDAGFAGLKAELREHRRDMDARFEKVGEQLIRTQEMIIGLHATVSRLSVTLVAAAFALVATQTGFILTQL